MLDELARELRRAARARRRRPDRAVPRQRLRRVPHRARDQGGAPGGAASCSAAATSTPSCASSREPRVFDYCRLRHARRRRAAAARAARAPARSGRDAAVAHVRARGGRGRARSRRRRCTTSRTRDTGTPTYDGLPLDRYVSLFEMLNPMHRLWSDGRWNKLTDRARLLLEEVHASATSSLDYIARYEPRAGRRARRSDRGADRARPGRPASTSSTRRRRPRRCARSPSA